MKAVLETCYLLAPLQPRATMKWDEFPQLQTEQPMLGTRYVW